MPVLKKILGLILIILLILFVRELVRTARVQRSPETIRFRGGILPVPAPEGFYAGSQDLSRNTAWKGKKFFSASATGINIFGEEERYPFRTYTALGLKDPETEVLKIDYNISLNPLWLRPVLDEIVQVAPDEYLGKVHYRLIPGLPFTLGYFHLKK